MKSHRGSPLLTLLTALLILTGIAFAQVTTTSITGTVNDASGAAVANASVTVKNTGTGATRTTQSDSNGQYTVANLPPGIYEVSVEAPSFSKSVLKSIELNVGTRQTVNISLKPGQATEIVEVTTDAIGVETTRSDIGGVVTPTEVENLPLLNRTFAALSVIMPEARPTGNFDPTKTRIGNVAFNGGDGRQVDVNVDGGDNKDNVVGSLLQNFAYEGIQEFQVLQHRWTAEQGRAVGGVVNVVTKSGTNTMHGSFFANFRDEALRKMDFFEKQSQVANPAFEKQPFSRQEIGGSIGGPIVSDKLFYFGALERFRERQTNVVTAAAQTQLAAIPGITPVNEIPTPYDDWLVNVKSDAQWTNNQHVYFRYAYQNAKSPNDQIGVPATSDLTNGNSNTTIVHSGVFNHTWTVTPTTLNQFSFHVQDFNNGILGVTDTPNIVFPSVQTGRNVNVPQATLVRKYQFRDDFSWNAGSHALKIGTNYINTKLDGFFFFGAQGYQISWFDDPLTIKNNVGAGGPGTGPYTQGFATPGAVRQITFSDGRGDHKQSVNQLAFYFQDDWKITSRLTLNLGLRWDANIGNLPAQNQNRTILLLQQLNHPLAQQITGNADDLRRTTPSWTEFQPRLGFAYDPTGAGRTVIRGGYGIFYDQIFQNLTLFSLTQSNPEIYQTLLSLTNNSVGNGQLATFRYGVDPLPTVPGGASNTNLVVGGFGRINDPQMEEPYVQKWTLGFETTLMPNTTLSSDYVHTLGVNEPRVQVINPRIRRVCDPLFPGSTPADARCVRGANTRLFDQAFAAAGLGAGRLEQINMFSSTNRSLFDSWTTTLRHRGSRVTTSVSYVLASSRAWGGQPVASYSGNGIAIVPDNQFLEGEFGPTRIDERHRIVASGVFNLPWGFQLAPIVQFASARPYSLNAGVDLDGDGLTTNDRICNGVDPLAILALSPRSATTVQAANPRGCAMTPVNSFRGGYINGEKQGGHFFNIDLRAQKTLKLGERVAVKGYADFYNLFDRDNLNFTNRLGNTAATSSLWLQPNSLFGPGFGPPVGRPLTVQLGFRVDF